MVAPFRVMTRIFGTQQAVDTIHRTLLKFEANYPSTTLSIKQLSFAGGTSRPHGLEVRGEAFRHLPGFAEGQDFLALSHQGEPATIEWIVDTQDKQTYEVAQNGICLFKADRQANTADAYDLGESGLVYIYSNEVGIRSAFLDELGRIGPQNHGLKPI